MLYEEAISSLVHQIIRLVYPQKIILFGSAVRSEMNKDSDIDLLVVINKDIHKRMTEQMLYQNIEGVKIPYDILYIKALEAVNSCKDKGKPYREKTLCHEE